VNILVACEFSGTVRDAFTRAGHFAVSCDLIPSEAPGWHYLGDVFDIIDGDWDLMIAHPPCTHLAVSGARWFKGKEQEQAKAVDFFTRLADSAIPRVAVENPISIMSTRYRKPDQIIQPWQHGHGETKSTCLWLRGLPVLKPSNVVEGREAKIHHMAPGKNRWKNRSRTYPGIAESMASQWGSMCP
jgi:hypothetical protein